MLDWVLFGLINVRISLEGLKKPEFIKLSENPVTVTDVPFVLSKVNVWEL